MMQYVKNGFVEAEKALVSLNDRGFRFGDGVFETFRVAKSAIYQLDFQMRRLSMGLNATKIFYHNLDNVPILMKQLIKLNNIQEGFIRVYITRGEKSRGYLPLPDEPNLYITTSQLENIDHLLEFGVKLHISQYENISTKSLPRKYKLAQGLNSILSRMEAIDNECFESVLLNQEQYVSDCSSSNIFLEMKNGRILTPNLDSGAVMGSIRHIILSNFSSAYNIEETIVTTADLANARSIFITNISWLLLHVREIPILSTTYHISHRAQEIREFLVRDLEKVRIERVDAE